MKNYEVHPIGKIHNNEEGTFIELEHEYILGIQALDGFSHIVAIWWFSELDHDGARHSLEVDQPYKKAPLKMGTFATRAPMRPNPIALTTVEIIGIDYQKGIIRITYIDAIDGTPLLDIKPYTPSLDRVEAPGVPVWCAHWPKSIEQSGTFPWEDEFNF